MSVILDLPKVHFGFGSVSALRDVLAALGVSRPLFITDAGVRDSGGLAHALAAYDGDALSFDGVTEPPSFTGVDGTVAAYRSGGCDGIVALGGGAVIDTAKMACVVATHEGTAVDYCGRPERIVRPIAPLVVLPTTSGSGSEVSPSTGIHPEAGVPALRTRHPALVAKVTICDPELTLSKPPRLTAASGLDALTHCIEGYLAPTDNPVVDAIALSGIAHVMGNLERAVADGADREARSAMMMGSLEGGISISKGLGPAHAMAMAFSHWPVAHGVLAAVSLPPSLDLMEVHAPDRTARIAQAMGLPAGMTAADGFRDLLVKINALTGLPLTLRAAGCTDGDPAALAAASHECPVNRTSPYYPTMPEFRHMVDEVLG